ncbi:MAG: PAS domain S-box protein [Thermodesulfobacteriota bacterium]
MTTLNKGKEESRPGSDDRFRLLFNYVADALFLHDLEGRFVEVNQAACDSLGYTQEELLQLPVSAVEVDLDCGYLGDLWDRISEGDKLTVQGLHRRKDGTTFPVEIHFSPFEYSGRPHILASARDITQRLCAEEALRTSEAFLYSIVDQSPYPMWISDDQGTLIKLNQACQDLLHLTAGEVVGKYNVFQDNIVQQQGLFPLLQRVFKLGETVRFELTYDTSLLETIPLATHTLVILDVTVFPILDGRGQVTNAVFQHVDITPRKRAEAALAESEQRFKTFMDHLPAAVFIKDQEGRLLFANPYLQELFGWEDCLGKATGELLPPELAAGMVADDQRALTDGPQVIQERIIDIHGEEHFFDTYKFPIVDAGIPTLVGGVAVEVTERKRAEEELQREKMFTEAIVESLPGTFFIMDAQGMTLRTNAAGSTVTGYSPEELSQMQALDFIVDEDKPAVQQALEDVFAKGEVAVEAQLLTKDGRKIPFLFTAQQFTIDGQPCLLGTGVDITERKRAEEALRESEERFRCLAAAAFEAIIIHEDGILLNANDQYYEMAGYEPEEILGKQAMPLTVAPEAIESMRKEIATGGLGPYESIGMKKDGTKFPMEIRVRDMEYGGRKVRVAAIRDITERRRAEEALRESEERYRSIFQNHHTVMLLVDPETGAIMDANPAACAYYGFSKEELLARKITDFNTLPPEQVFQAMQRAKTEKRKHFEFQHRLANGAIRDVEVFTGPIRVNGQELLYSIINDVTARRRAEKALRESERAYRSLYLDFQGILNTIPDTVCLLSPDLTIVWANQVPAIREDIPNLSEIGKRCYTQRHGRSEPCEDCPVLRCFRSGKMETEIHGAHGKVWELRAFPIYDDHGELRGGLEVARDITERKNMEEALRESQALYHDLVETAQDLIWQCDAAGRYTYLNPAWEEVFGYKIEEMLGRHFADFQPQEYAARDQQEHYQLLQGNIVKGLETVHLAKDGRKLHLVFNAKVVRDKDGRVSGMRGTAYNITERKLAEEALRQSEARFRQMVESSPLPIALATAPGIVEYVNPKFVETFGYTLEDVSRLTDWFRLAYPDPAYRQSIISRWEETLGKISFQEGASEKDEVEIACKDGSKRIMQIFGSRMGNTIVAVFNDLTERKRMEEALEKRLVALSRPLDDAEDIDFHDLFNLKDIQLIQDLFAEITGVSSLITTPAGAPITQPSNFCRLCREIVRQTDLGTERCSASDAHLGRYNPDGPNIQHCLSAGLCCAGASITVGGKHIANWLIGQVRDELHSEKAMRNYARTLEVNEEEFIAAFREIPLMSRDRFQQVAQALFVLANQLSNLAYHNVQQARFITERKRMEERLREKEKKFRSLYLEFQGILNTIPDILCLVSPDLRIVWGNDATVLALPDAQPSDVIGKHCYPLRHERSEPCENCPVLRCFQSGKIETEEVVSFGEPWELRAVPLYDDQGELRGAIELARNITERKRAEEALRESEERLRLALQAANQGLYDLNIQTGEIKVTPEYATMLGYDPAEFQETGTRWVKRLHPDDQAGVEATYRAYLRGEIPDYAVEFRQRTKAGDWKWILSLGKIVAWDNNGRPLRMLGTHTDITPLKQMEASLSRTQFAVDRALDAIHWVKPDGGLAYGNQAFCDSLGYSCQELHGMSIFDIDALITKEQWQQHWQKVRELGSLKVESLHKTKDGRLFPVEIAIKYINFDGEEFHCSFARDISERKRAEEALRDSERRLSEIIDFLPDATFATDLEGKVIAWNRAIEEMTGVRAEDIIGKGNYEYTLPFYGIRRPALIDLVFTPDEEIEKKYVFVKKDGDILLAEAEVYLKGETQLVWAKARPLYNSEGEVVGAIEAIRDISERKRAEEERARMEAQMREVQKLESLGVLAGGIAHDFNNLLMAILGNADLALLSLSPASPARPNVEEITRASQRAAELCRQMLAYSGKGRFVVGRYDLSEIVREMTQMLEISVSKKATLRYSYGEGLPPVEADATQLRQVIMNLITNASEALEDQSGYISVSTGVMDCDRAYLSGSYLDEQLPEGRYVYLEVADTGCGLDEETQRRIFDPFFTTKFTGRGLGLAAVLGIVRGHHGAIKVYSEPGQGTTFKILLPAAAWQPGDRADNETPKQQILQAGTILLIDDDPDVRRVGSQMLERLGFKVLTAAQGLQGLEVFRTCGEEIDCVLLDLTMPEMSGDEVFRELRRLYSGVRVILSSGYNEQEVTQRFVGKGLAGFIQKPYTVAKLQEVLNHVLDQQNNNCPKIE